MFMSLIISMSFCTTGFNSDEERRSSHFIQIKQNVPPIGAFLKFRDNCNPLANPTIISNRLI